MGKYRKLTHVVYRCDYHIVFVPKYRYRVLSGPVREDLEKDIKMICVWKEAIIEEMSIQKDHVHLVVSIPPKVSISEFMGTVKGKTVIRIFKSYPGLRKKSYWGNHFWARGYFVSTVGIDEELIKRYVRHQEKEEKETERQRKEYRLF